VRPAGVKAAGLNLSFRARQIWKPRLERGFFIWSDREPAGFTAEPAAASPATASAAFCSVEIPQRSVACACARLGWKTSCWTTRPGYRD